MLETYPYLTEIYNKKIESSLIGLIQAISKNYISYYSPNVWVFIKVYEIECGLCRKQLPRTLKGNCRKRESAEAEKAATRQKVITRLSKASLVPLRAAVLVAEAVSAFKGIFGEKD